MNYLDVKRGGESEIQVSAGTLKSSKVHSGGQPGMSTNNNQYGVVPVRQHRHHRSAQLVAGC